MKVIDKDEHVIGSARLNDDGTYEMVLNDTEAASRIRDLLKPKNFSASFNLEQEYYRELNKQIDQKIINAFKLPDGNCRYCGGAIKLGVRCGCI